MLQFSIIKAQVKSEEHNNSQDNALKVFIDGSIDDDYMKREVRFVNYVRDTRMADVYLLVQVSLQEVVGMNTL